MSLHAAPTPVTNPYQRPLLSVRWMHRMPTGPIGAEARTPMTIPLNMKSRMFISIGNAKFILLVSLQFLTGGKVTKFRAQSTIFSPKSSFYSRFLYFRAWITRITRMFYLYYKLNFRMWIKYGLKTQSSQKQHALKGQKLLAPEKNKNLIFFIHRNKGDSKVFLYLCREKK